MSALGSALADYLKLRRGLGYKLEDAGRVLPRFLAHLEGLGTETVTVAVALAWATEGSAGGVADRMEAIRGFAGYLQSLDPAHEVPPAGLVPGGGGRAIPHLYSDDDVVALMAAARALTPPLRGATTEIVIGLLAVSGIRIGEVLALDVADVDWQAGVVSVRSSKFDTGRHVPVDSSTLGALDDYRQGCRDVATTPALFLTPKLTRLRYPAFATVFGRLLDATGIGSGPNRPRIHDLRHSFAVKTILGWYREGADVHALLPRLSTYLGHSGPAATYWYLSAAPELMAIAAERLEREDGR
jgi:integrase/recombinase XerD